MPAKIIEALTGITKKLSKFKFDDAIGKKEVEKAEKTATSHTSRFQKAVEEDYKELQRVIKKLLKTRIKQDDYVEIAKIAFSLKSRAGNANNMLASNVANSLYKFCDEMAMVDSKLDSYDLLHLHNNALEEIFSGKFPADDKEKSERLVAGLEALCAKHIKKSGAN